MGQSAIVATPTAQAQTFKVIYTFTGGADGGGPQPGLTMDGPGSFYGATGSIGTKDSYDCGTGCGTAYRLSNANSSWILTPLYQFQGFDGLLPSGRVALARDGSLLYGVTNQGGQGSCQFGCGTVYHLTPAVSALALWKETVIHYFTLDNGSYPQGDLTFDQVGNLYGTALVAGPSGNGLVYQLTRLNDGWVGTILYPFQDFPDGQYPVGGVIFDKSGNLYGVTQQGGRYGGGIIYQLSLSGSTWTKRTVYEFTAASGCVPGGGLIIDTSGNLYGTTTACGAYNAGTVFKLTLVDGSWTLTKLYSFTCCGGWCGPGDKLVMDAAGNLYGTTIGGGAYGCGNVFKLTPSGGRWSYTSLHDFTGQSGSDEAFPTSSPVLDASGNLYGTASQGGTHNMGTVFEITP